MKIDELISELEDVKEEHGNLKVHRSDLDTGTVISYIELDNYENPTDVFLRS